MRGVSSLKINNSSTGNRPPYRVENLSSLDRNEIEQVAVVRPDRYRDISQAIQSSEFSIARGAGLSYCLASAGNNSVSVSMAAFNRVLEFSADLGEILIEAGMSIGSLQAFVAGKGFWFPVLPGYPQITIGGCVAMNVHGKSQYHSGLFGDHVAELWIVHPKHGDLRCSRTENSDLFYLTLGGFGLTGIITRVRLTLGRLKGRSIERIRKYAPSLNEAVKLMLEHKDSCDQVYSWNDLSRHGDRFGAGYVFLERFTQSGIEEPRHPQGTAQLDTSEGPFPYSMIPLFLFKFIPLTYRTLEAMSDSKQTLDLMAGAFPLVGKESYFKVCRARNFREAQIIIPTAEWENFAKSLAQLLNKLHVIISLGSLKLFKGSKHLLNFQQEGICIAIDLPMQPNSIRFLEELDTLMLDAGGIPNISKDSRLSEDTVSASYPGYEEFRKRLSLFDPDRRMRSNLRSRIGV